MKVEEYPVYGTKSYSIDSALCASAFHDGSLHPTGGDVIVVLEDGLLEFVG